MARILFVGQQPETVDFTNPVLPPGMNADRKAAGREAKLCYMGHATMENRHGLAVAGTVTFATGTAERRASEIMLKAKAEKARRRVAKAFYSEVMGWGVLEVSVADGAYTLFTAGNVLVSGLMDLPEQGQRTGGNRRSRYVRLQAARLGQIPFLCRRRKRSPS